MTVSFHEFTAIPIYETKNITLMLGPYKVN